MDMSVFLDRSRDRVVFITNDGDVADRLDKQEAIQLATKILELAGQINGNHT